MGRKEENENDARSRSFYGMSRQERLKAYDPELDFLKPYANCLKDDDATPANTQPPAWKSRQGKNWRLKRTQMSRNPLHASQGILATEI